MKLFYGLQQTKVEDCVECLDIVKLLKVIDFCLTNSSMVWMLQQGFGNLSRVLYIRRLGVLVSFMLRYLSSVINNSGWNVNLILHIRPIQKEWNFVLCQLHVLSEPYITGQRGAFVFLLCMYLRVWFNLGMREMQGISCLVYPACPLTALKGGNNFRYANYEPNYVWSPRWSSVPGVCNYGNVPLSHLGKIVMRNWE